MAPSKVQPMLCLRFQINSHIIIYTHIASIVKQVHAHTHVLSSPGKSAKGTQDVLIVQKLGVYWPVHHGESLIHDALALSNGAHGY